MYLNTRVPESGEVGVVVEFEGDIFSLPADTVMAAIGVQSVNNLATELDGLIQ